jgi:hypothetical protein
MPGADETQNSQSVEVEAILLGGRWEVYLLPVSEFPSPKEELLRNRQVLERLTTALGDRQLSSEVFLDIAQVHLEDGSDRLADHAREWKPKLCLGVWPDRPAPTRWTREELEELAPGDSPRPMMYTVLYLSGSQAAREEAFGTMLGLGAVVRVLTGREGTFLSIAKQTLQPTIQQRPFRSFPNFMPLFDRKSLTAATSDQLEKWFCGADLYIRESPEDKGIIVASNTPLAPIFQHLGGQFEHQPSPHWRITY